MGGTLVTTLVESIKSRLKLNSSSRTRQAFKTDDTCA
ncbi:hypothetical protein L914_10478 [Phytophthora nicotianae]|uniref:Uncharacterized protein n=2 Tax=Phytophthora nicotianae TaxID=4792 RepID=W2N6I3_PHYNI|nr:hypothetical protein L914_10478 [Phytophthora nicotianae]ETO73093.1 hypothetical protein F444_10948 [Phytophthora nicotianae P1976]